MWPRPGSRRPPPGATRCGVMLGAADAEWCRFGADSASAYPHVGGVFSGLTTPLLPEQDTGAHGEQAQSAPGGSDLPPWLGALAAPAGGRVATADSGSAGCVSHKPQSAQFCPHFTEGRQGPQTGGVAGPRSRTASPERRGSTALPCNTSLGDEASESHGRERVAPIHTLALSSENSSSARDEDPNYKSGLQLCVVTTLWTPGVKG